MQLDPAGQAALTADITALLDHMNIGVATRRSYRQSTSRSASSRFDDSLAITLSHVQSQMEDEMPNQTEAMLQSHLQAAGVGVDAVMKDYSDASVLITHDATFRGLAEIRGFFFSLLNGPSRGFIAAFKMHRQEVVGEVAYILWEARPWFPFATDTFVVRNGKILFQIFSASPATA